MDVKELFSLKDKVVFMTGGEGLYGRCILESIAEAGGTVITASIDLEGSKKVAEEFQQRGLDVHGMFVDQSDHKSVMTIKAKLEEQFGGIDVFINCAVARPMRRYDDPLEMWSKSMDINATGMFDIVREIADLIAKRGGGSIVNISSMLGMFGPDFSNYEGTDMDCPPDYCFHKGGMIALTKYLARKLASKKIRVNCVSPGGLYSGQPQKFLEIYGKKTPLGRMASPDDIKGVVVFLASEGSAYITGENILMDGGMHC